MFSAFAVNSSLGAGFDAESGLKNGANGTVSSVTCRELTNSSR